MEGGEGLDIARITRPHWSWNWHLPLLTCVHLTSEFAYRFEFKMLRGCPQLEILGLNMNSIDGPHTHTRVLSCADMFVLPSSSSSSPSLLVSSNVHQEERIIAPNLRSLVLSGHWVIDDTLLGEFLAGIFPKLRSFTECCSGGITLAGVLNMIRTRTGFVDGEGREVQEGTLMHLRGVTVSMSLPHSHEEMDVLGVYHGSYRAQERLRESSVSKARVKFEDMTELQRRQFRFSTLWCVVLREPISLSFEGEER
ncbi:MAG: hypothetical protein J3R72DRAFT_499966 [Linnemannia gamsii]|nr:MAG: hypothetical protein J3R72DRAFT_499966 [Linnemannia gamsii]